MMAQDSRTEKVEAAPAKSGRKKTALMVIVILVLEAVGIIGAFMVLGPKPASVSAVEVPHSDEISEDDKIVEEQVLKASLSNSKSGVTYVFATEIYVQVRQRHALAVKSEIEQFQNEIKADITAIWRIAEPQHFQEPKLETLTRKIYAMLNDRFGNDETSNQPLISKVVVVMGTGFRMDS